MQLSRHLCRYCCTAVVNVSDMTVLSRGKSVRDRRHRPMSHDDSYGPQLYIPAGCSGEVARPSGPTIPSMAAIKNSSR